LIGLVFPSNNERIPPLILGMIHIRTNQKSEIPMIISGDIEKMEKRLINTVSRVPRP
jgi:hypothetical protein